MSSSTDYRWRLDDWTEMAKQRYVSSEWFARIYAYLGKKDQVFEQSDKTYQEHEAGLPQTQ